MKICLTVHLSEKMNEIRELENEIHEIGFEDLSTRFRVRIPNFQRSTDLESSKEHIEGMVEDQLKRIRSGRRPSFPSVLQIAKVPSDSSYFIIDGQHRYFAMKKLVEMGHPIRLRIERWVVETPNMIKKLMALLNVSKPIQEYELEEDETTKTLLNTLRSFIEKRFKEFLSKSEAPRRPNFKEATLIDKIKQEEIPHRYSMTRPEHLLYLLYLYNQRIRTRYARSSEASKPAFSKCEKHGLYIGMDPGFESICDPFEILDPSVEMKSYPREFLEWIGDGLSSETKKKKTTIPKSLQTQVFETYASRTHQEAPCWCCETNRIRITSFQCGHVVPESKGGPTTLENLRPICTGCNQSMGSTHMIEWMREYYPKVWEKKK